MGKFLLGLLAGMAAGGLAVWLATPWPMAPHLSPPVTQSPASAEPDSDMRAPSAPGHPAPGASPGRVETTAPVAGRTRVDFRRGTATLRIGQAYRFGDPAVRADPTRGYDIRCLDIRQGAHLDAPHGGAAVELPAVHTEGEITSARVFDTVNDAPERMPTERVWLLPQPRPLSSGVALVRAADGRAYKLQLLDGMDDPDALNRTITLRYAEVPTAAGGGWPNLAGAVRPIPIDGDYERLLTRLLRPPGLPADSFSRYVQGTYTRLGDLGVDVEFREQRFLALDRPLSRKIALKGGGAVYANAGIAPGGHVSIESQAGAVVRGDMAGEIDVKSYAYVRVSGDLRGTLNVGSYATVVIDGDILQGAKLRCASYVTLLLRGRIHEPVDSFDIQGSCWSTYYLERHLSLHEFEALRPDHQVTLHVRSAEFVPEPSDDFRGWDAVIVGDKVWDRLVK